MAADQAARLATEIHAGSVFDFWRQLRDAMEHWRGGNEKSPAASAYGVALVERALIDACCRDWGIPFATALSENALRLDLGDFYKPLADRRPHDLLPPTAKQLTPHRMLPEHDGEDAAAVETGFRAFQVTLSGEPGHDFARLKSLAERLAPLGRCTVSLDGASAFTEPAALRELWETLTADPATKRFALNVTHLVQPFAAEEAISNPVVALFAEWPNRPPVVIGPALAAEGALARALEWGYSGSVYRADGGILPAVADACLLGARRDREPVGKWTFAAELTALAPSQPAELAVCAAMGLESAAAPAACFASQSEGVPEAWRMALRAWLPSLFSEDLALLLAGGALELEPIHAAPMGCPTALEAEALD